MVYVWGICGIPDSKKFYGNLIPVSSGYWDGGDSSFEKKVKFKMHRELNKSAKQNVKVWTLYFIWDANVGFNLKKEYFSPSLENIFSETICQRESFFSYLSLNLTEGKVCLCCKFKQPNYSFRHQTDNVAPEKLWNWERGFGVWGPFPMSTVLCPTLFQNWNNFNVKFKSIFLFGTTITNYIHILQYQKCILSLGTFSHF